MSLRHPLLLALLVLAAIPPAWAASPAKTAEYRQTDPNFYLREAVLKADPTAVIIAPGGYHKKDDSYFIPARKKPAPQIYVEVVKDWLEPITPPSMPTSLGIAPDAMQIREPQGDVQVALPSNPSAFVPATDSMSLPNGTLIKTGGNGSAAVLFGGINSARLAPNSEAAVQQTVTPDLRSTRVDLKSGAVFSKVGLRKGEKQDYQVHTPFGVAAARGTDFVTVALPNRTDVWIAQGTVQFDQPDGQTVGTIKSTGNGTLKIIRFPTMDDAHQTMMADAETMTAAMNFIPLVNLKVKALHDQVAQGQKLNPSEKKYLGLIKKVPVLIALTLVEPPAPTPPPPPPPAPVTPPPPPPNAAATPTNTSTPEVPLHSTLAPMERAPSVSTNTLNETNTISNKPETTQAEAAEAPLAPVSTGPGDTTP
jgi:hypothetical protein